MKQEGKVRRVHFARAVHIRHFLASLLLSVLDTHTSKITFYCNYWLLDC